MDVDKRKPFWHWFLTLIFAWTLFVYALWNLFNIAVYEDVFVAKSLANGGLFSWHWVTMEQSPAHFAVAGAASVAILALIGSGLWGVTRTWLEPPPSPPA